MDETKKALLTIDIDVASLNQNTANAKKNVADLTAQLKVLKGTTGENSVEAVQLAAQLKNAQAEVRNGVTTAAQYDKALKSNSGYLDGLKIELALVQKAFGDLSKEELNNADIGGKMQERAQELAKEIQKLDQSVGNNKSTIGTYENSIVSALSKTGLFGSKISEATETFNTLKTGLSTAAEAIGVFKKSGDGAENTVAGLSSEASGAAKGFTGLIKGTEGSSSAFKLLKVAIAETGIGLLIIILAAVLEYLSKFEPVMNIVKSVTAAVSSAFDVLGGTVVRFFQGIKSVGDFLGKLGDFFEHPIDSVKSLGKEMGKAAEEAYKLEMAEQRLARQLSSQDVINAQADQQIAALRLMARNRQADAADREKYLKQATTIEEENYKQNQELIEKRREGAIEDARIRQLLDDDEIKGLQTNNIKYAQVLLARGRINKEQFDKLKEIDLAEIALLQKRTQLDEKNQNQADQIADRAEKKREAAEQKAIAAEQQFQQKMGEIHGKYTKAADTITEAREASRLELIKNSREKETAAIIADYNKRIDAAKREEFSQQAISAAKDKRIKAKMIETNAEIEKQALALQQERNAKLVEQQNKFMEEDIKSQHDLEDLKADAAIKALGSNYVKIHDMKTTLNQVDMKFELDNVNLTEEQKRVIREKYRQKQLADDKEFREQMAAQANKKTADKAEGDIIEDRVNDNPLKEFADRQKLLDMEHNQAVTAAKKKGEDTYKIDAEYKEKTKALSKERMKLEVDTVKGVAMMLGENTQAYKIAFKAYQAYQAGQVVIDTERAIMGFWAGSSTFGPLGIAMAAAETALAVAQGASAEANIWKAKGFYTGGVYHSDGHGGKLSGPGNGTSDSINARLSNGESIINARSTAMFAPLLSALNVAGGGRAFDVSSTTHHYASGGMFNQPTSTTMAGMDDLQQMRAVNDYAKTVAANMPRQVLVVEDVQAGLQNKVMLQNMSNF